MLSSYARRSSDDIKWTETKKIIDRRDGRRCQFEKCLTITESKQLKPGTERSLDRAHIFSASGFPDQIYNTKNVIILKRFIHRRMDEYKCPLTGYPITLEEHWFWWYKIYSRKPLKYNPEENYELKLREEILYENKGTQAEREEDQNAYKTNEVRCLV